MALPPVLTRSVNHIDLYASPSGFETFLRPWVFLSHISNVWSAPLTCFRYDSFNKEQRRTVAASVSGQSSEFLVGRKKLSSATNGLWKVCGISETRYFPTKFWRHLQFFDHFTSWDATALTQSLMYGWRCRFGWQQIRGWTCGVVHCSYILIYIKIASNVLDSKNTF